MDTKALRALSAVILLPALAWLGLGLYHWLHGTKMLIPAFLLWAALVAAVVAFTLFHAFTGRAERIDRGSRNNPGAADPSRLPR